MLQSRPQGPHETFELSIDPKGVNPAVPAQQDYPCAFPASRLGSEASVLSASSGCPGAAGGVAPHLHQQGFPFRGCFHTRIPGWPVPSSPSADPSNKVEHPLQGERLVAAGRAA